MIAPDGRPGPRRPIRVLVVDDSVVIQRLLRKLLNEDPELEVVGVAGNGLIAIERVRQLKPDVVTLDVEMPELDGLGTLAKLRPEYPNLPIVMFSTLTERGAAATLDALSLGASDYVTKPANVGSVTTAMERVRDDLVPKLKALCPRMPARSVPESRSRPTPAAPVARPAAITRTSPIELVVIGTSTGGPNALGDVLSTLPANLGVPIVIVQHMPPVFTRLLAERLADRCKLRVHEAVGGMPVEPGHVYLAPGDHHLTVDAAGTRWRLGTNHGPPVHFCRPSVDVLFSSVAAHSARRTLAVVLTGMGSDGRDGCAELARGGAHVVAQDQATSVVWGMPGAVVSSGSANEVLPLAAIGPRIEALVATSRRKSA